MSPIKGLFLDFSVVYLPWFQYNSNKILLLIVLIFHFFLQCWGWNLGWLGAMQSSATELYPVLRFGT